jgi:hypothetical protein
MKTGDFVYLLALITIISGIPACFNCSTEKVHLFGNDEMVRFSVQEWFSCPFEALQWHW